MDTPCARADLVPRANQLGLANDLAHVSEAYRHGLACRGSRLESHAVLALFAWDANLVLLDLRVRARMH